MSLDLLPGDCLFIIMGNLVYSFKLRFNRHFDSVFLAHPTSKVWCNYIPRNEYRYGTLATFKHFICDPHHIDCAGSANNMPDDGRIVENFNNNLYTVISATVGTGNVKIVKYLIEARNNNFYYGNWTDQAASRGSVDVLEYIDSIDPRTLTVIESPRMRQETVICTWWNI